MADLEKSALTAMVSSPTGQARVVIPSGRASDYADVLPKFQDLCVMDPQSVSYRRLRDAIICRCLPLADHIAQRFDNKGQPKEDLVQVARVGLVRAVNRFDPDAGSPFLAFAVPTIIGEVRRYFRDNSWAVHKPRRIRDAHGQLNAGIVELSQRLGRSPTATELGRHLGLEHQTVVETMIAGQAYSALSLDGAEGAGNEGDEPALGARIGSNDDNFSRVEDRKHYALWLTR